MSRYMPHETLPLRAAFCRLGVPVAEAPARFDELMQLYVDTRPTPALPAIYPALAQRVRDFEHESEYLLVWMLWEIQHMLGAAVPSFIDVRDPDALLAEVVCRWARRDSSDCLPAAEQAEVARWIDFLADAYDERVQWHDAWDAKRQKVRNAALKGAATRRARQEAQAHA